MFDEADRREESGDLDAVNEWEARIWLDGPTRRDGSVGGDIRATFLEMNGRILRAEPAGDERTIDGPTAWDRLGELTMPVAAIVGRHDLPLLVERTAVIASSVPDGAHVVLPDTAHLPQLDDPDAFHSALAAFLPSMV